MVAANSALIVTKSLSTNNWVTTITGRPWQSRKDRFRTNYKTTHNQDKKHIRLIQAHGYKPNVKVYNCTSAQKIIKVLQRRFNNPVIYPLLERTANILSITVKISSSAIPSTPSRSKSIGSCFIASMNCPTSVFTAGESTIWTDGSISGTAGKHHFCASLDPSR